MRARRRSNSTPMGAQFSIGDWKPGVRRYPVWMTRAPDWRMRATLAGIAPERPSEEMSASSVAVHLVQPHPKSRSLPPPFITTIFQGPGTYCLGMLMPAAPDTGKAQEYCAPTTERSITSSPSARSSALPTARPLPRLVAISESPIKRMRDDVPVVGTVSPQALTSRARPMRAKNRLNNAFPRKSPESWYRDPFCGNCQAPELRTVPATVENNRRIVVPAALRSPDDTLPCLQQG